MFKMGDSLASPGERQEVPSRTPLTTALSQLLRRLMGNRNSCCVSGSPSAGGRKYHPGYADYYVNTNRNVVNSSANQNWPRVESANQLQHISEREPDDLDQDPSSHPTKGPLFMERSQSEMKIRGNLDMRRSMYIESPNPSQHHLIANGHLRYPLRKASSCSTVYLDDSTISQPNLATIVKCISLAVFYHIKNRKNRNCERIMDIFDEKLHPLTRESVSRDYDMYDPTHKQIHRFIRTLFSAAQLTAECAIITLVYIERLLTYAELDLCPSNWKRAVLGAILLASKVWDDQAVWNVDYCQILKDTSVEDMNELERQFLECLQFNINVPSSVYAKYYFDLRTLALANNLQLPLQPLYRERAKKLEALSRICEDKLLDLQHKRSRKRWNSLDRVTNAQLKNTVVIS